MEYLQWLMDFVAQNQLAVMATLFALLIAWTLCNACQNVYGKQISAMQKCRRLAIAEPDKIALHIRFLPEEYRRQWRAYVKTQAQKPSLTFEFVKKRKRWQLLGLPVALLFVASFMFGLFVVDNTQTQYVIFDVAYLNAVCLAFVVIAKSDKQKQKQARFAFGRLVAELNRHLCVADSPKQQFRDTLRKINDLAAGYVTQNTLERAASVLKEKGLEQPRTVSEQQKLNNALNGLLQAYARHCNKSGKHSGETYGQSNI